MNNTTLSAIRRLILSWKMSVPALHSTNLRSMGRLVFRKSGESGKKWCAFMSSVEPPTLKYLTAELFLFSIPRLYLSFSHKDLLKARERLPEHFAHACANIVPKLETAASILATPPRDNARRIHLLCLLLAYHRIELSQPFIS